MNKVVKRLSLIAVMAASYAVAGGAERALALPSGCSTSSHYGYDARAYCTSGAGGYRVYTDCDVSFWWDYRRYGPWVTVGDGGVSIVNCDYGDLAYNISIQFR